MRLLSFNPNVPRLEPRLRVRRAAQAAHLRIIEGRGGSTENGRLIPFHSHSNPQPAA